MQTPVVSILITGSEILDGRVPDTNSHLIIDRFSQAGFSLRHTLSCGDDPAAITSSLSFLLASSDAVIVSGGMGPTSDDLTREVLAAMGGVGLELRQGALNELMALYASRGRTYDRANDKQAMFPVGSVAVKNPVGTAPGFLIELPSGTSRKPVVALPGVPGELRAMLDASVLQLLAEKLLPREALTAEGKPKALAKRQLRVFGLPESVVGSKVLESKPPSEVIISYRAAFPEVHVILKAPSADYDGAVLDAAAARAREALGPEYVISESLELSMDQVVHSLLQVNSATISTAESCTGGMLGELFTSMPGSSETFLGGMVTYGNQSKMQLLGVSPHSLEKYGAVSFQVAAELAEGAKRAFGSAYALSTTGIAGPGGGSEEKPVGTFFIGIATPSGVTSYKCFFPTGRQRVRRYATYTAADICRRALLSLPVRWPEFTPS
jgi:nicotinamide-nucleotide amidase